MSCNFDMPHIHYRHSECQYPLIISCNHKWITHIRSFNWYSEASPPIMVNELSISFPEQIIILRHFRIILSNDGLLELGDRKRKIIASYRELEEEAHLEIVFDLKDVEDRFTHQVLEESSFTCKDISLTFLEHDERYLTFMVNS